MRGELSAVNPRHPSFPRWKGREAMHGRGGGKVSWPPMETGVIVAHISDLSRSRGRCKRAPHTTVPLNGIPWRIDVTAPSPTPIAHRLLTV
jgi:hypothetical protein